MYKVEILEYLKISYPNQFVHRISKIQEIYVGALDGRPLICHEQINSNGASHLTQTLSLFGSPGHNDIWKFDPVGKQWERAWEEVPVSGVSSVWKGEIPRQEFVGRFGKEAMSDDQIKKKLSDIVPMANLSNLHITVLEFNIQYA